MTPAYKLLHFFSKTATICHKWDDSLGKRRLWDVVMAILIDIAPFNTKMTQLDLLTYEPILFKCPLGMAIYTIANMQVNVNVVITHKKETALELLQQTAHFLTSVHAGCAINLNPIKDHMTMIVEDNCFVQRRFVPCAKYVQNLEIVDGTMVRSLNVVMPLLTTIVDPYDLKQYTPIMRMKMDDDPNTLYWHRFDNGQISVFENPFMPNVEPLPFPFPVTIDDANVCHHVDESMHPFLKSLYPITLDDTAWTLSATWIPMRMREFAVVVARSKLGLSDELIRLVGDSFQDTTAAPCTTIVLDMFCMYQVMNNSHTRSDLALADDLRVRLQTASDQLTWRQWIRTSPFIMGCLRRLTKQYVALLCDRFPPFLYALLFMLHKHIGNWKNSDVAKSSLLKTESATKQLSEEPDLALVVAETKRVQNVADTIAKQLSEEPDLPLVVAETEREQNDTRTLSSTTHSSCRNRTALRKRPHKRHEENLDNYGTRSDHKKLLQKIRVLYHPLVFDLIGSGLFTDTSDVDLIVTVPSEQVDDLQSAYKLVMDKTGWTPCYTSVTGENIAILVGQIDGVSIDAQIWRGEKCVELTKSEQASQKALHLSRKLRQEVYTTIERHICWLHRWCVAANVKGHCFCRLPGIAVTSIAIAIGCRLSADSSSVLLRHFYRHIHCLAPYFDMNEASNETKENGERCVVPLVVNLLDGENCATRMTVGTTTQLLDTLAFALSIKSELLLNTNMYTLWRRRTMVRCARLRPLQDSSVSQTLHVIANELAGHPYIDALYFEQELSGCILVLCTLLRNADVKRYGFHESDQVIVSDAYVTVQRKSREIKLMLSPHEATVDTIEKATVVHDMIIGGCGLGTFPNAPCLTMDVVSRFDKRFWTCVW
jgi:hypothetical protein